MEPSASHPSILTRGLCAAYAALAASAAIATGTVPAVSNVAMSQAADRTVTIAYDLADGPAVVTLDIETNRTGAATANEADWISIGGGNISGGDAEKGQPTGDVWKKVEKSHGTITWHPDATWFGHKVAAGGIRAKVTAWALDDTPDYMLVSLAARGTASPRCTYYPGPDFIPGGVGTNNAAIRSTSLLMRKIKAKGVTWAMGPSGKTHNVTLTNNYYIGVFEVTQAQWREVWGSTWGSAYKVERWLRPVECVSYNVIRCGTGNNSNLQNYPDPPYGGSFLGKLRNLTDDLDFDLPSEAEWEYACRAGHANNYWGDGSEDYGRSNAADPNLDKLGRYARNGGKLYDGSTYNSIPWSAAQTLGVTNGTAVVGSYAPNSWGLYDMHGNAIEWVLDLWQTDITGTGDDGLPYNGRVNAKDATTLLDGTVLSSPTRVMRGGAYIYEPNILSSGFRSNNKAQDANDTFYGFRVVCRAGLK